MMRQKEFKLVTQDEVKWVYRDIIVDMTKEIPQEEPELRDDEEWIECIAGGSFILKVR